MDFSAYLEQCAPADIDVPVKAPDGSHAGTLVIRAADRATLDRIRGGAMKKARNGGTELDDVKLRTELIKHCVVAWRGITYASAAKLANRVPPPGEQGAQSLPFSPELAVQVLGRVIGIEDTLYEVAIRRIEADAATETDEKNA